MQGFLELLVIMDAILGAAGMGDIGLHFPDNDDTYKDASSMMLLENVMEKLEKQNYKVVNIDATIIAQKPKLRPFIKAMEENVASVLHCDISYVNIKATTEEHLGFTGREEGISAQAVCLLYELYDGSRVVYDSDRSCERCSGCAKNAE